MPTIVLLNLLMPGGLLASAPPMEPLQPPEPIRRQEAEELIREAKTIYGVALLRNHYDRLIEAMKLLEKAAKLDPEAIAARRALVPIYRTLGRDDDAVDACRFVLKIEPTDCDTANEYVALLRSAGKTQEAADVLGRALENKELVKRPDFAYRLLLQRCDLLEKVGDFKEANTVLQRLVQLLIDERLALINREVLSLEEYPVTLARTYERIGMCCVQQKAYDEAIKAFVQGRDFLSKQADAETRLKATRFHWQLAEVQFAQGNLSDALRHLDEYLDHRPLHAEAYERKVTILRKLDRSIEVVPTLKQYARKMPKTMSIQLLLARELSRERGNRNEAQALYRELAERFGTVEVYRGWFKLLQANNDLLPILDMLDDAYRIVASKDELEADRREIARQQARSMMIVLRSDPALVNALLPLSLQELRQPAKRDIRTWQLLATLAAKTRHLDTAEKYFRQCLVQVPIELEYEVYSGLIIVFHDAHKPQAIVELCQGALEGPRKAEGVKAFYFHQQMAMAYADLGKDLLAVREAENAVKFAPDKKIFQRKMLARLLAQAGKYDLAIAECQSMLKEFTLADDIRQARYALAVVCQIKGDYAGAEAEFRKILEDDPNDPEANNNLGYQLAERNEKLAEAEKLIRRAIEVDRLHRRQEADPDLESSAYMDSLAWVLFRQGKLEEARKLLEAALQIERGDDNGVLWDHLGDVYSQQKEPLKAKQAWSTALEQFKHDRRSIKEGRPEATRRKLEQTP